MTRSDEIKRELEELDRLLHTRVEREPFTYFLSSSADRLPHLRVRIDQKFAALGSSYEQAALGDEDYLGLIADLIEYRIALFNHPVPYFPSPEDYAQGEAPADMKGAAK